MPGIGFHKPRFRQQTVCGLPKEVTTPVSHFLTTSVSHSFLSSLVTASPLLFIQAPCFQIQVQREPGGDSLLEGEAKISLHVTYWEWVMFLPWINTCSLIGLHLDQSDWCWKAETIWIMSLNGRRNLKTNTNEHSIKCSCEVFVWVTYVQVGGIRRWSGAF